MLQYKNVQTFEDLLKVNTEFLKGNISETPYHCGPIDDETTSILDDLISLNKKGFLTVNSQPAKCETGFVEKTWYVGFEERGNWWYSIEQIPFVEGYFSIEKLDKFIQFMKENPKYYYKIYSVNSVTRSGFWGKLFPSTDIKLKLIKTNMSDRSFNLTREKSATLKTDLEYTEWEHYTNLHHYGGERNYDFYEYSNIDSILVGNTVKVIVTGKEYNKGSCTKFLLDFF